MNKKRVVVFGIDGATFEIIEPAIKEGLLPNLARLMKEGAKGRLESTRNPVTPMAWTSFATGTNAGKHGIFDFSRKSPDGIFLNSANNRHTPAIWSYLTNSQRPSVVVNVPFTYPAEQIQGVLIPGFDAPSVKPEIFHPESVYHEMVEKFGDYHLDWTFPIGEKLDIPGYVKRAHAAIEHRGETSLHLLKEHPWDFFMIVFSTPDHIQHVFWKYPNGHEIIRNIYQACDDYLGKYLECLSEDDTVMIMSDHGFGPINRVVYLDNWLEQEGFLARRNPTMKQKLIRNGKRLIKKTFSKNVRKWLRRSMGEMKGKLEGQEFDSRFDWARTQAFSFGYYGNIFINLKSRFGHGSVDDADYDRVCEEVSDRLLKLRDPVTNELAVEKVYRKDEIYDGDQTENAPDLVVGWKDYQYYTHSGIDQGNEIFADELKIEASEFPHSGTHRMDGVFIAKGPGIRSDVEIEGARIIDLAPTIMHAMGEQIPELMDGIVLDEIFESPTAPVKTTADAPQQSSEIKAPVQMSEDEEAAVRERLRSLGYID